MKVYAVIVSWGYEGCNPPSKIFLNKEAAEDWAKELVLDDSSIRYRVLIEEYEVDETNA